MRRGAAVLVLGVALSVATVLPVAAADPDSVGMVDPSQSLWHLLTETPGYPRIQTFYYGNPGDYPFMGDWDCDGVDTPGLYRQSDGYVYLRNSNTQGIADVSFFFGNPGDVPIAGDFNADGCDTVSIYRPSEQRFYIINKLGSVDGGLGAAEYSFIFGNPGDDPFVGDFDGDGLDTIGLHRETSGLVYYRNTNTQGNADNQFVFGNPGDRFVAGDWNRDGTDSPSVYRPASSTHFFRFTNTEGNADKSTIWGEPDWLPVAGQFGRMGTPLPGEFAPWSVYVPDGDVVPLQVPGDDLAVLTFHLGLKDFYCPRPNPGCQAKTTAWSLNESLQRIALVFEGYTTTNRRYPQIRPVNTKGALEEPIRYLEVTTDWSDAGAGVLVRVEPLSFAPALVGRVRNLVIVRVWNTGDVRFTVYGVGSTVVWAKALDGRAESLVETTGDYAGTFRIPEWADYLDIVGSGSVGWSIELIDSP
jgi:hypothetical protein